MKPKNQKALDRVICAKRQTNHELNISKQNKHKTQL